MTSARRDLKRARSLLRTGEVEAAWEACAGLVEAGEPQGLLLAGQIALAAGHPDDALDLLQRALLRERRDPEIRRYIGRSLVANQQHGAAVQAFCDALELRPDHAGAWADLGLSMLALGKGDEASTCFRKVLDLAPEQPRAVRELADTARARSLHGLAVACYRRIERRSWADPELHASLGSCLLAQGRADEAAASFRRELELRPAHAPALANLGDALVRQGDNQGARDCFRAAAHVAPREPSYWVKLGYNLVHMGRLVDAERQFRRALRLEESADAVSGLASVLERRGAWEEAYQLLRPLAPDRLSPLAAARFAAVCKHRGRAPEALESVRHLLARSWEPAIESILQHALADLLDATGDHPHAFAAARRANDLRGLSFEPVQHRAAIHAVIQGFRPDVLGELPRASTASDRPILIVGLPRSGTTLVEQMLAAHPQVHAGGELDTLRQIAIDLPRRMGRSGPYYGSLLSLDQELVDTASSHYRGYLEVLSETATRVTDKMPHNFLHLGLAELILPGAHVLHCTRDPLDVGVSLYFQNLGPGLAYATRLDWIGHWAVEYQRLMAHWRRVLTLPVLEVPYADLVTDPDAWARRIVSFCGLPWNPACARPHEVQRDARTASHAQVRAPVHTRSIGRARHYAPWLGPLRQVLDGHASGDVSR